MWRKKFFCKCVSLLIIFTIVPMVFAGHPVFAKEALKNEAPVDWKMYMHDIFHTGVSPSQILPPFFKKFEVSLSHSTDSSPIIVNGKIYIGDKSGNMYCIDAESGKIFWEKHLANGSAINSTPAWFAGNLYFGDKSGNFVCENADTGNLIWKFQAGGAIFSSPLVVDYNDTKYVIFGSLDRTVYCLNGDTGKLEWEYTTGDSIFSSPVFFKNSVIIGSYDGFLYRFEIDTGKILWKVMLSNTLNGVTDKIGASPSVDLETHTVFVGSYNHYLYALDANTGDIKWERDLGEVVYSTADIVGNTIICGALDKVAALDKLSGKIKWTYACNGNLFSSPTVESGYILVEEKNGDLSCLNIQDGEREWNFKAKNGCKSVPLAYKHNVYFVAGSTLYAFSDKQHAEKPILFVSTDKLDFGSLEKGTSTSKYFTIKNVKTDVMSGDIIGLLSGTISTNVKWITVTPEQFSGNKLIITVTVDTTNLKEGHTYNGKIFVTTNGGNSVIDVVVFVKVNPNPILSVNIKSVDKKLKCPCGDFEFQFYITNSHRNDNGQWIGVLKGKISSNVSWISVSPTSFKSNKQLVNVVVDTSSFEKGKSYSGVIEITTNGGNYSIPVNIFCEKEKSRIIITLKPGDPYMTVNGVKKEIDPGRGTKPVIIPKWSRTVVPIRAIVEALGGTIEWDGKERKVTINFNETTIELWIGKPQARVNGVMKWIDENNHNVKPIIINDRTMLPLRFVVENLGCKVNWDPASKTITIIFENSGG